MHYNIHIDIQCYTYTYVSDDYLTMCYDEVEALTMGNHRVRVYFRIKDDEQVLSIEKVFHQKPELNEELFRKMIRETLTRRTA